jgi:hypothetical protein
MDIVINQLYRSSASTRVYKIENQMGEGSFTAIVIKTRGESDCYNQGMSVSIVSYYLQKVNTPLRDKNIMYK